MILNIIKKFNRIFPAKTISGILKKFYNIKISYKHLYFIIKNNYLKNIRSAIFSYLKFGLYQNKQKTRKTKRFITKSIDFRPKEANERLENNHFEVDTIEGKKSDINNIFSMIDRKNSKLGMIFYKGKLQRIF